MSHIFRPLKVFKSLKQSLTIEEDFAARCFLVDMFFFSVNDYGCIYRILDVLENINSGDTKISRQLATWRMFRICSHLRASFCGSAFKSHYHGIFTTLLPQPPQTQTSAQNLCFSSADNDFSFSLRNLVD